MSAAATAAGYLYASGRLRGRGTREQNEAEKPQEERPPQPREHKPPAKRRDVRVAAYRPEQREHAQPAEQPAAPKRVPKIQYRTRRWRPDE